MHPYACFLDYNYRPIDVDLFTACYPLCVLYLYVGEINVLPISNFILLLIIYDPYATQKASVGMHSGCDYLLSLKILFVYFLALPSLLHPSILFKCFYTCFCSFLLHECNYYTVSTDGRCRSSRVRVKVYVITAPLFYSPRR